MFDSSMNFAKIRVVGVGGAGNNAINRMIESDIQSADFYAINTDKQPLILSKAEHIIQIGQEATQGLGAGSDPELGERAAEENRKELEEMCEGVNLLFIAAGMGGGTGTGAAPVIAKIAKEKGCLTVAVVTKPFAFEGIKRQEHAATGINNLKKYVDTLIIIPNDKLIQTLSADTPMLDALKVADDNLRQGICGIADLIATPALINLDFADVKTIIQNQGLAHMGRGRAKGENRIIEAVRQAVSSPLLETTIEGAHGVIINVTGGRDLTIGQVNEAARLVQSVVDESANIIFGANIDYELSEEIDITVIATGFEGEQKIEEEPDTKANPMQAFEILMKKNKTEEPEEEKTSPEPIIFTQQPMAEEPEHYNVNEKQKDKELPSFVKKLFGKK
ncbi:MAG: cell division protein FtsZ [Candidatus Borkfalkiaceae bacterium]|nr:cell division protein FtsZ [Christensenellaceae bacterium]